MVLSILIATIAAPGLLASQEAIRQSQSKEKKEEHRARRCNLIATCVKSSVRSREINGRPVVLSNGKLWIDTGTEIGSPLGHPYAGYYLPYPDSKYEGLVTTITDVAPIMNWVYVDKDSHEIKYGVRADAQTNLTGPFDCTRQDRRLTFDGWEGWCAVEEAPSLWALYFDVSDDGLKAKVAPGTRVLEVELSRKEKKFQKEPGARQQDQTTKRSVDVKEDAPVDKPLPPAELVQRPGVVDVQACDESAPNPIMMRKSVFDDPTSTVEVQPVDPEPKPFKYPGSIMDNRPPALESLPEVRAPPKTPPPAYSPTVRPEEALRSSITVTVDELDGLTSSRETKQNAQRDLQPLTNPDTTLTRLEDALSAPSMAPANRRVPFILPPLQSNSTSEKRITPKLNRNSGTRALAQAEMFEAMAAAWGPNDYTERKRSQRTSRDSDNAVSAPEYSNDGRVSKREVQPDSRALPLARSPKPTPLAPAVSKAKASLVQPQETVKSKSILSLDPSIQRATTPPSLRNMSAMTDPAVFRERSSKSPQSFSQLRRPKMPRSSPTSKTGVSVQQLPSQSSGRSNDSPRLRRDTAINQPHFLRESSSRNSPSSSPLNMNGSARRIPPAIMTTEKSSSQSTASQIVGSRSGNPSKPGRNLSAQRSNRAANGRKTTSALFREIDELVSQEVSGPTDAGVDRRLRRSQTISATKPRVDSLASTLGRG